MTTTRNAQPKDEAQDIDLLIGQRVHQLMWDQKVTNKQMGELLGVDATAIGKKLRAYQKFSVSQLAVIATFLNSTIAYLVGESDEPHPDGPTLDYGSADSVIHVDFTKKQKTA